MANKTRNLSQKEKSFFKKIEQELTSEAAVKEKQHLVAHNLDTKNKGPIKKIWQEVQELWQYVKSDEVEWHKKILPLVGLVYLVLPIDAIPDFIFPLGYVDDAAVLMLIYKNMRDILAAFVESQKRKLLEEQQKEQERLKRQMNKNIRFGMFIAVLAILSFFVTLYLIKLRRL
ncbi:MAG: DUF1232 domain-containing protein [Treponema sp.]|jgi:uncharacterized membrane protein YkvA (DUF1232 family)|nr:DUF1232 domain-containing protein [Treponema sp.]